MPHFFAILQRKISQHVVCLHSPYFSFPVIFQFSTIWLWLCHWNFSCKCHQLCPTLPKPTENPCFPLINLWAVFDIGPLAFMKCFLPLSSKLPDTCSFLLIGKATLFQVPAKPFLPFLISRTCFQALCSLSLSFFFFVSLDALNKLLYLTPDFLKPLDWHIYLLKWHLHLDG